MADADTRTVEGAFVTVVFEPIEATNGDIPPANICLTYMAVKPYEGLIERFTKPIAELGLNYPMTKFAGLAELP